MLEIHGPTYRYQGHKLSLPEVIYVKDHHYDLEHGYALQQLLDHSACPAEQHLLVFDHVNIQDEFGQYPHVCVPLLLAAEAREFNLMCEQPIWPTRTHAFNFMINKPRPHRLRLMDLVLENNLDSYRHSLCWQHRHGSISPTQFCFGDEHRLDQGILNGRHANAETYDKLLKANVFDRTCVSLVTEPAYREKETIITEKTIMAVWSGTIPIWVGGWRCADYMRSMGFDVFTDIVDHSYQRLPDPDDRVSRAIKDNVHLLRRPMDMSQLTSRLRYNLDLIRDNVWLRQVHAQVQIYSGIDSIVRSFRNGFLVLD